LNGPASSARKIVRGRHYKRERAGRGSARLAIQAHAAHTVGERHDVATTSQDLRSRDARPIEQRTAFRIPVGVATSGTAGPLHCPLIAPSRSVRFRMVRPQSSHESGKPLAVQPRLPSLTATLNAHTSRLMSFRQQRPYLCAAALLTVGRTCRSENRPLLFFFSNVRGSGPPDGTTRRAGLPKLRVRRPQAFLCAGACVRAHTLGARTSLVSTAAARTHTRGAHEPRAHRSCGPGLHDILLTRIAAPVQWRCRRSESRQTLHGGLCW
jgi:hypothetical protein